MKKLFITFEGIEGSGKSTQSKMLYEFFLAQKKDVILTREPGGTKVGEKIREILIDEKGEKLTAESELLLNFVARLEHVEKVIKPALKENKTVISDRFFDSSYAYQGSAMNLELALIDQVRNLTIKNFAPDITFLIDVPVELAFKRIDGRAGNNRYEKLGFDFHQKVRDGFLKLASENKRIILIDGTKKPDEIFNQITSYLK